MAETERRQTSINMSSRYSRVQPSTTLEPSDVIRPMITYEEQGYTGTYLINQTLKVKCVYDAERDKSKTFVFVLFVPVLTIIALCGLITNSLSYIVLRKEGARAARTPDLILRVLSIADNFVLIAYVLFYTLPYIYQYTGSFVDYYEWFMYAKRYIWFLLWFSKTFSVYTVVLLTIDRYIAVCKPLQANSFCTKRNATLGIILVVTFSIVYNIPKLWYVETIYKLDMCSNTTRPVIQTTVLYNNPIFRAVYVNILYLLIMFFVPLNLLLILNIFLVKAVRKARKLQVRLIHNHNRSVRQNRDNVTERVIAVVTTFIILESPAVILNAILIIPVYVNSSTSLGKNETLLYSLRSTYVLSAINSCINFYIYCLVGKRFRKLVMGIICPKRLKNEWLPMTSQTRSSLITQYQPPTSPFNNSL